MRSRTALCDALASWATAGEAGCYRRVIQPSRCIAFAAGSVAVLPMLFRLSPAGIARCAFLLCIEDIAAKACVDRGLHLGRQGARSEEHTSELQSLMRISYAVFCLKQK